MQVVGDQSFSSSSSSQVSSSVLSSLETSGVSPADGDLAPAMISRDVEFLVTLPLPAGDLPIEYRSST